MTESTSVPKLGRNSTDNRWYYKSIDNYIKQDARELLENYSHIPADEVDSHIYRLRDILWDHAPYPCIGEFKFLTMNLPTHPLYNQIINKLNESVISNQSSSANSPPLLLDLGCCVAQELRALAYAGIKSEQLCGSDLNPHFLTTSYDLFKDKDTFRGKLIEANIFSPDLFETSFQGWENKFSVIHAGLFLHLFSWEQQIVVCSTITELLDSSVGSLFVGEMVGCACGGERNGGKGTKFWKMGQERKQFLHDGESFKKLWNEVAAKTDTVGKWKIVGNLKVREKSAGDPTKSGAFFTGDGIGWFTFSVERVKL